MAFDRQLDLLEQRALQVPLEPSGQQVRLEPLGQLEPQEPLDLMAQQVVEELLDRDDALPHLRYVLRDRRATWVASAGLTRPSARVAQGLWAAGDYVDGPYPSTLEGAVRSGLAAAQAVLRNDTR